MCRGYCLRLGWVIDNDNPMLLYYLDGLIEYGLLGAEMFALRCLTVQVRPHMSRLVDHMWSLVPMSSFPFNSE